MAYDRIYYFDKINHRRYELGEIQTNFNLNIVIDGDKDSMQIDVHSYSREALQPNTIIYHVNDPLQWFVVKKDNVKRNANEKGFYYIHSITLNGAIDLTKNRDLTDCGFNANGYTIDEFFKKLLKLSNFEFDYEIDYGNNVDKDKKVDYIKSYENYTLLSAIRDFFNGYNCEVKLGFQTKVTPTPQPLKPIISIDKAIFKIIPRTGNIDLTPIDISEFNDIRESINFDKESYGTTVISNAQNVVSTLAKTYPQTGGVTITGTNYDTNVESAYIKLPSPVWKVNWVKAICPLSIFIYSRTIDAQGLVFNTRRYLPQNYKEAIKEINEAPSYQVSSGIKEFVQENEDKIKKLFDYGSITFYNNPSYNPRVDLNETYGTIVKEEQTPYIPFLDSTPTGTDAHQVALMDKESASLLKSDKLALIWERGSERITNVNSMMGDVKQNIYYAQCDLSYNVGYWSFEALIGGARTVVVVAYSAYSSGETGHILQRFITGETFFQVNYIPMSDLKVKQDNENNNNDIQLYNQNGKLNDSVALSKMVDSYSKEITNPTITRYGEYYNINDIPQVGQIVMDGNTKYVINNISYNLYPCESDDEDEVNYYCECEFTLAEFISTKSIMTSPNTNVRDYGIPQKCNIKRRQVYRDYYEFGFSYETLANMETPYAKLENYLQLGYSATPKDFDHTALIKIKYEQPIGTNPSDTWYYQLNSTAYTMAKSVYEVIDFDDNNIIGYDIANSTTGFRMSNLWDSRYRAVTTPVSYVDDFGKFVGITLQMTGKDTLEQVYSRIDTDNNPVMFSAHCFIPKEIYDLVAEAPYETLSETTNKNFGYIFGTYLTSYTFSFVVSATELGIPDDIEIDNSNVLGLESRVIVNGSPITDYELTIDSFSGRNITVRFSALNSVMGASTGTINIGLRARYINKKSIADYVIDEQDYEKDPIEVPVFEYSLQLGDTKDVEVGDNVLLNRECIFQCMNSYITNGEITALNSTKYQGNLVATGGSYNQQEDKRTYGVIVGVYPVITLEQNNTKMRIKFYNNNRFLVDGNHDQTIFNFVGEAIPITPSSPQVSKNQFIGKDIVIFKNSIKTLNRDDEQYETNVTFERDLMFIIHRPTESQFENDDLIINVNYYKLK